MKMDINISLCTPKKQTETLSYIIQVVINEILKTIFLSANSYRSVVIVLKRMTTYTMPEYYLTNSGEDNIVSNS